MVGVSMVIGTATVFDSVMFHYTENMAKMFPRHFTLNQFSGSPKIYAVTKNTVCCNILLLTYTQLLDFNTHVFIFKRLV